MQILHQFKDTKFVAAGQTGSTESHDDALTKKDAGRSNVNSNDDDEDHPMDDSHLDD